LGQNAVIYGNGHNKNKREGDLRKQKTPKNDSGTSDDPTNFVKAEDFMGRGKARNSKQDHQKNGIVCRHLSIKDTSKKFYGGSRQGGKVGERGGRWGEKAGKKS